MLTTVDGALLIKPAVLEEVEFYQNVAVRPELAPLRPFIPKFLGTIKLEGSVALGIHKAKMTKVVNKLYATNKVSPKKKGLVLENLSFPFTRPNVLDVKLGTVLYDDTASQEKREKRTRGGAYCEQ